MYVWFSIILQLSGLLIHIWTIIIAFKNASLFEVVLTAFLPVISEIYWFFKIGSNSGFINPFSITLVIYAVVFNIARLLGRSGE